MYMKTPNNKAFEDKLLLKLLPLIIYHHTFLAFLSRYRKREIERQEYLKDVEQEQFIPADETLSEMLDHSSGSGSGLPLLVGVVMIMDE